MMSHILLYFVTAELNTYKRIWCWFRSWCVPCTSKENCYRMKPQNVVCTYNSNMYHLSVYLSIYLFMYLSKYLSIYPFIYLSKYLSINKLLYIYCFVYLVCYIIYLFVCLPHYLFICLLLVIIMFVYHIVYLSRYVSSRC